MSVTTIMYRAITVLALLAGLFVLAMSLLAWLRFQPSVPIFDTLLLLPLVDAVLTGGPLSVPLGDWFELFGNAHRILVSRLLAVADFAWFGGRNLLPLVLSWLCLGVIVTLFLAAVRRENQAGAATLAAGVCLVLLFSPSQMYTLVTAINASWYVALTATALAFTVLVRRPGALNNSQLLLVLVLAMIAAFSNFAGVIACLMLCAVAFIFQVQKRWPLALLLALFVALYLQGVQGTEQAMQNSAHFQALLAQMPEEKLRELQAAAAPSLFERLQQTASALVTQLSAGLVSRSAPLAYLLCAVVMLYLAWQGVKCLGSRLWRAGQQSDGRDFFLMMALFCLGILLAISLGRGDRAADLVERYLVVSMLFWASVACMLVVALPGADKPLQRLVTATLVLLLAVGLTWRADMRYLPKVAKMSEAAQRAQALMGLEVTGFSSDRRILPLGKMDGLYDEHRNLLVRQGLTGPDYLDFDFDDFPADDARACTGITAAIQPSQWSGVHTVELQFSRLPAYRLDRAYVYAGNEGIGRLYPVTRGPVSWVTVARGSQSWHGYVGPAATGDETLRLVFVPLFGAPLSCSLG